MKRLVFFVVGAVCGANAALAQPDFVSTPPPPTPANMLGPELWRGARIGMAPSDVTRLFPTATASTGEALRGGAKSALVLATKYGETPVTAQFYFDTAAGLTEVIVDRADVVAGKTDENLVKARALADQITAVDGAPARCDEQRLVASMTCLWRLGDAKAILSYRDIGGAKPALSVSYRKFKDTKPWAPGPVRKLKAR